MSDVYVFIGSESDKEYMKPCFEILDKENVPYKLVVSSAHRNPDGTREKAREADKDAKVIIAGAGYSAALPGFIASLVDVPVIGVPIPSSPLLGIDALLSIVQMPGGVPVVSVGIGKSSPKNAALFAIRMIKGCKKDSEWVH